MLLLERNKNIKQDSGKLQKFKIELEKQASNVKKAYKSKQANKTKNEFKRLTRLFYKTNYEAIGSEYLDFAYLIRIGLICGISFCINPLLAVIVFITDKIIKDKVSEKDKPIVLARYSRSIKLVDEKIKSGKYTGEELEDLKRLKEVLETKKSNIDNYFGRLDSYKKQAKDIENKYGTHEDDDEDDEDPYAGFDLD